jgi:hypothetical protein
MDDFSSFSNDIGEIKIYLNIKYINVNTLEKNQIYLIMDNKSFEVNFDLYLK